jgi:hypothetical protein
MAEIGRKADSWRKPACGRSAHRRGNPSALRAQRYLSIPVCEDDGLCESSTSPTRWIRSATLARSAARGRLDDARISAPRCPRLRQSGGRALIDLSRVPGLDDREIGFARLVARAGLPAVGLKEIRRRAKRVGGDVEIAGAVSQDVLRQELRLADFAVHGAARAGRQHTTIDQLQSGIELLGENIPADGSRRRAWRSRTACFDCRAGCQNPSPFPRSRSAALAARRSVAGSMRTAPPGTASARDRARRWPRPRAWRETGRAIDQNFSGRDRLRWSRWHSSSPSRLRRPRR